VNAFKKGNGMTGAEGLVRSLMAGGVDTCFTNPGTSEIHVVAALDGLPQMRCVLGLFEGVVTGAADGFARMTERPACTLLHLGPGFANGMANLHNASRAHVPMVNLVGQHPRSHLPYNAPLTSDIEAMARPYSKWLRTSPSSTSVGRDAIEAIAAARNAFGQIATLIVPADVAWGEGGIVAPAPALSGVAVPAAANLERAASLLRSGSQSGIVLSGRALYGAGLRQAGRVAAATGAKLFAPYPLIRQERGPGLPVVERMQYALEQAVDQLKQIRQLILVGAQAPVAYFAYPGKSSVMTGPECQIHALASPEEDCVAALDELASLLSCPQKQAAGEKFSPPDLPSGSTTLPGLAAAVGALLPENAIVVDESMTSGRGMMAATQGGPPHDWLGNTGGSIGIALPLAVGAAVACPERKVLCLSADGSGMYTLQALWTMAREGLKITTVIFANRSYAVLKREFSYLGAGDPGKRVLDLFEIGRPDLDWVQLAQGMGVPASRAITLEGFARALREGFESGGPSLIEVPL
jgi:acetolactate synthase-1/2/3 large subunit